MMDEKLRQWHSNSAVEIIFMARGQGIVLTRTNLQPEKGIQPKRDRDLLLFEVIDKGSNSLEQTPPFMLHDQVYTTCKANDFAGLVL
jgi:hypothetical protein